ncbi:hypothetical protein TRFO_05148 [Tritrichomonas foetus]|uniref:Uncharacterized protein n=1 Tax=Tritrichomonas foetus TaxID=1144522 RepID=A0A1J4K9E4_9EUKA|nr:hypothetical protein TRFO_05148 [Tritrichomonas foetus]|eukprot:OHT07528.1 hypothetical protein TRFO_05148 [Tritrichomonas foetus]
MHSQYHQQQSVALCLSICAIFFSMACFIITFPYSVQFLALTDLSEITISLQPNEETQYLIIIFLAIVSFCTMIFFFPIVQGCRFCHCMGLLFISLITIANCFGIILFVLISIKLKRIGSVYNLLVIGFHSSLLIFQLLACGTSCSMDINSEYIYISRNELENLNSTNCPAPVSNISNNNTSNSSNNNNNGGTFARNPYSPNSSQTISPSNSNNDFNNQNNYSNNYSHQSNNANNGGSATEDNFSRSDMIDDPINDYHNPPELDSNPYAALIQAPSSRYMDASYV